jgi:hypothetical protein
VLVGGLEGAKILAMDYQRIMMDMKVGEREMQEAIEQLRDRREEYVKV